MTTLSTRDKRREEEVPVQKNCRRYALFATRHMTMLTVKTEFSAPFTKRHGIKLGTTLKTLIMLDRQLTQG
jgi:hypothetical protein